MAGGISGHQNMEWGAKHTGIFWGEARDAAKHAKIDRTAPRNKALLTQNVNSAEAEKPALVQSLPSP